MSVMQHEGWNSEAEFAIERLSAKARQWVSEAFWGLRPMRSLALASTCLLIYELILTFHQEVSDLLIVASPFTLTWLVNSS